MWKEVVVVNSEMYSPYRLWGLRRTAKSLSWWLVSLSRFKPSRSWTQYEALKLEETWWLQRDSMTRGMNKFICPGFPLTRRIIRKRSFEIEPWPPGSYLKQRKGNQYERKVVRFLVWDPHFVRASSDIGSFFFTAIGESRLQFQTAAAIETFVLSFRGYFYSCASAQENAVLLSSSFRIQGLVSVEVGMKAEVLNSIWRYCHVVWSNYRRSFGLDNGFIDYLQAYK